jgi:SAM-dependent MidA family methyltransferase
VPFHEVVELALYDPVAGFFATGGKAGRQGDFLTSPEVGPLFGAVVARAIDAWWVEAGSPDVWTVIEVGAGTGTLARTILAAEPACRGALRYVLVERSAVQRRHHAHHLPLEEPAAAFASATVVDEDTGPTPAVPTGPIAVSLGDLPRVPGRCVVVANELLDNLPFGLLERTVDGWAEVHVGIRAGALTEVLLPLEAAPPIDAPVGARVPHQETAAAWVRDAVELAGVGGRVLAFDYAATSAAMAARPSTEWLRTYRRHQRGSHPLEALGTQDITCEVAIDQLPAPATDRSQAEWLRDHGIEDLVEQGRRTWHERAAIGDLAAMRARSRITEAEALLDPSGLGGFRALEWMG